MTRKQMDLPGAAPGRGMAPLRRFTPGVLESDSIVPVVLEFEQPPVAVFRCLHPHEDPVRYEQELAARHREFLERLASLGIDVQMGESDAVVAGPSGTTIVAMRHDFTQVFNGIGVLLPGRVVATVARMAGVRAVTLNKEQVYLQLEQSVSFIGAKQIWERADTAGRNLRGEGVVVAVIDTGIDYTHPAFGGYQEVPNEKVIHAVSLTGEHPLDNFGHGTHVAGIIAADADYKNTPRGDSLLNGVAPKAKLMGYKVLTASGSGSATNIILAMEDAVKRGAHVMNLSLGNTYGDPYSPESSAANNAMKAGVLMCVAAGNAGPEDRTVGAPGAAHHVITVGASTDDGVTALIAELRQEEAEPRQVEMRLMEGSRPMEEPTVELQYADCGNGLKVEQFPAEVRGQIALIQRGESTFREKALLAQQAGALACVIYNNRPGSFFGSLGEYEEMPSIPVVGISQQDGQMMLGAIRDGQNLSDARLRLSPEEVPQPDRLAEFSSRGPTSDGWIKPELTAPGVNINSATITQAPYPGGGMPDPSGYVSASGTSMATPHVAGAAALIRQAHPEWTALQIKAALVNTARFLEGQGTVAEQGNGAMDLVKAIDCRAVLVTATDPISPTCSFGQVVHGGEEKAVSQALTIQPLGAEEEPGSYQLSVEIAGNPEGLRAELSAASVVCDRVCRAAFDLRLIADGAVLPDGAYYGWVIAQAEWGTLRLPFYCEMTAEPASKPERPREAEPPGRKRVGEPPCC